VRFSSQQEDRRRLPVALLSGFLGSGKTTLINALLRDPRLAGTAVAVNEFGEVPLDHELIDHGADRTVVLANGCLCCNLAGDMEDAVMRLFSRRAGGEVPHFARLVVEPSGLADPTPIAQAILRNPLMARAMRLEAIVTTVDAMFGQAQLTRHAESRKQVALADHLVITKPDLAGQQALDALGGKLRQQNPLAPITMAEHGVIDAEKLFPPQFFDPAATAPAPVRTSFHAEAVGAKDHLQDVTAVSLTAHSKLQWRAFDTWLRGIRISHAEQLLRVKAILDVEGTAGPVVVQGVHHVLHAPVELAAWPGEDRSSRIVMIADRATGEMIRASWQQTLETLIARH
jgi:G3E family GTPase